MRVTTLQPSLPSLPGTASITATCSYPDCNINVPAQYSLNVVTATVSGNSTANVYAASTKSTTLIPISTSTNTAGTAITLPYLPNSIIIDPAGNNLYLGSSSGLMAVSTYQRRRHHLLGERNSCGDLPRWQILADLRQRSQRGLLLGRQRSGRVYTSYGFTTHSSAYTPDSKSNEWVSGTGLGVRFADWLSGMTALPYTANALGSARRAGSPISPAAIPTRLTCAPPATRVKCRPFPRRVRR